MYDDTVVETMLINYRRKKIERTVDEWLSGRGIMKSLTANQIRN